MDKLIYGIGIFAIAWCVFANYDFKKEDGVLRAYTLKETYNRTSSVDGSTLPEYSNEAVKEYRLSGDQIVEKVGPFINEYSDCVIFDVKNFTCTLSDESATFGAKEGLYFERINVKKFPHLTGPLYAEAFGVSRFGAIVNQCKWWFTGNIFDMIFGCALEPFLGRQ